MTRIGLGTGCAIVAALSTSAVAAQPAAAPASGIGPYVISVIEKACIPLIKGQDVKSVVQAAGLKRSHDDLVLPLAGVEKIVVSPPSGANPTVCSLELSYEVDQTKALADALGAWAASQDPPIPVLAAASSAPGSTSWSWALDTGQLQEGLVLNARRTADGKPLGRNYDVADVLYSRRGG